MTIKQSFAIRRKIQAEEITVVGTFIVSSREKSETSQRKGENDQCSFLLIKKRNNEPSILHDYRRTFLHESQNSRRSSNS